MSKIVQTKLNDSFIKKRFVMDIETIKLVNDSLFGFNFYKMGLGEKEKIIIGLYDGKIYKQFSNFNECLKYILERSDNSIVYAHNGGKYDYLYLIEELYNNADELFELKNIISLGSNIIFDYHSNDKKIIFRDSLKILPRSLKDLCKSFSPKDVKLEMNYDIIYQDYEVEEYLKNDCVSLYQILNIFEDEIKVIIGDNKFKIDKFISLASMSFFILNSKYLKGITKNYLSKEIEEWCRSAYYGGRVEIFKNYGKDLNYYDVNSLYPYVMKDNLFPIGKYFIVKDKLKIRNCIELGLLGIVRCKINYPYSYVTCLPYKCENKLMFPYGNFSGTYTTIEIIEALNEGAKIDLIEGIFWIDKKKIFEGFVDDFYKMKQNSTGAKKEIAKLILNSSYGKFGQKRKYKEIIGSGEYKHRKVDIERNGWLDEYEELGDKLFYSREKTSYKNRKINPIYAIFVTSYARIYLFRLMKLIGYDNLFYCDTDSIVCKAEFKKEIVHNSDIGKLKMEVNIINEAFFISPKFYAMDYLKDYYDEKNKKLIKNKRFMQIKIKGVDREIIKKMNIKQFKEIFSTKKFSYKIKKLISFSQKFSRIDYRENKYYINIEEIEKELKCNYDKRITYGNNTEPIRVDEELIFKTNNIKQNQIDNPCSESLTDQTTSTSWV